MQVLTSPTPGPSRVQLRRTLKRAALLLTLAVSACLLAPPAEVAVAFDHAVHVGGEQNLKCEFCHPSTLTKDRAGMPAPEICAPCHDDLDKQRAPDRRLRSYFDAGSRYQRTEVATLGLDLNFSHKAHVQAGKLDCAQCHGDIAHSKGIPRPEVSKRDCMSCHTERGVSNDCATCHREIGKEMRPASHDEGWLKAHGNTVRACPETSEHRCELCHDAQASCSACHREVMPADHTQHFRLRGHGVQASTDRSRCATCHHRRDFCSSCHEQTAPRSHIAGFGGSQNRHCAGCHLPANESGCTTCHAGGGTHPTATPLPVNHHPGMNCRQCHGVGVRLPHIDVGAQCTTCHR